MKNLSRWSWFAIAFLTVNAAGWLWMANRHPAAPSPDGGNPQQIAEPSVAAPQPAAEEKADAPKPLPPLELYNVQQSSFSPDRRLELILKFNRPVSVRLLPDNFKIIAENSRNIPWEMDQKSSNALFGTDIAITTTEPLPTDEVVLDLKVPDSVEAGEAAWVNPYRKIFKVRPAFRLEDIRAYTTGFDSPYLVCEFNQQVNVDAAQKAVSVDPPVEDLSFTTYGWNSNLRINGKFVPGQRYTVNIASSLNSQPGHQLNRDYRRRVTVPSREPAVMFLGKGRYLAPEGKLLLPMLTINCSAITCEVSRVRAENIHALVMRENYLYRSWYGNGNFEGLVEPVKECVVQSNAKSNVNTRLTFSLAEALAAGETGTFLVKARCGAADDTIVASVSDIGLSTRSDRQGRLEVWVTSLRHGQPLANVKVSAYAVNHKMLASGSSNANGLVSLKDCEDAVVLVAECDGDSTYMPLTDRHQVEVDSSGREFLKADGYEAFLMTDRDLYRPGDTVFVQALLRDRKFSAPKPFPVRLRLYRSGSATMLREFALMPDALGAATQEVEIKDYYPSGRYEIILSLPGDDGAELGSRRITVDSFVPPQTRVAFRNLPQRIDYGQKKFSAALFAEHLFGKPAAGLGAELKCQYYAVDFKPEGWDGYSFGDSEKKWASTWDKLDQTTDEKGLAKFDVELKSDLRPPARLKLGLDGKVLETSGRPVAVHAKLDYDAYPFYPGIKTPESGFVNLGQLTLPVALVAPDGKRWEKTERLETKLEQVYWNNALVRDGDRYIWKSERIKHEVSSCKISAGGRGDASATFEVPAPGAYIATVSDPASGASVSWSFNASGGSATSLSIDRSKPDVVEITMDKPVYQPGETAKIRLRAPFDGVAWVMMHQRLALESWVIPVKDHIGELEVKLSEAFAPNVEIAVSVVRPAKAENVWSAHRASGNAMLAVQPAVHSLKVEIEPPASPVIPAREMPVRVKVRDSQDRVPDQAAVTVMAVDEGICMLADYKVPRPNDFLFAARSGSFEFYDIYRRLMPIIEEAEFLAGTASHVGGGGDVDIGARLNPIAARRFRPVALWQGQVSLDVNGEALVPLAVPEFSGELRVMAVAWTVNATGAVDLPVKVRRPVVVQPDLPRMLAPGDATSLTVALHNESGADQNMLIAFGTDGPLKCETPSSAVALKRGESKVLSIPVRAEDTVGTAHMRLRVSGCGEAYDDSIELAVRPATPWQTVCDSEIVKPGAEYVFALPENALAATAKPAIRAMLPGVVDLTEAVGYLHRYPYSCLEQTVSAAIPLLALDAGQRERWAAKVVESDDIAATIGETVDRIIASTSWHGFSLWPNSSYIDPNASLWAGMFLALANRQGAELDPDTISSAIETLRREQSEIDEGLKSFQAYLCHILALMKHPDENLMARLTENSEMLDQESIIHLARAWILYGEVGEGRKLLAGIERPRDFRAACFGLVSWLELDPQSPMVMRFKRYIDDFRRPGMDHWGTTQDNALAIYALAAYDRRCPSVGNQRFALELSAGDTVSAQGSGTNYWEWASTEIVAAPLRVRNTGNSDLCVSRRLNYVPKADALPAKSSGITVSRTWLDINGEKINPAKLRRGDQVVVQITVSAVDDISDLVVEDLLPACLEIEKTDLCRAQTLSWIKEDENEWVVHREARDDRLLLFGKFAKSKDIKTEPVSYHYMARVVSAGKFAVPAIQASDMYNPSFYGRTAAGKVEVGE